MRRHAPALALLGLLTLLALAPLWPADLVFGQRDLLVYFLPMRQLVRQAWEGGYFPYRNPYVACGNPLFANPESQVLYPPAWGYTLLGLRGGTIVYYALHLLGGAMGANLLARRLGVAPWAALLSGVCYGFSGVAFSLFEVQNVMCDRLVPWMLWAALRLREAPCASRAAQLVMLEAIMIFGGEPSLFAAAHLGVVAVVAWPPAGRGGLARAAGLTALTALAAAGQLVPTTIYVLQTDRIGGMSDADRGQWSLAWSELGELALPGLLDAPGGGKHLGAQTYLPSIAMGFLPVVLVIAGAGRGWSRCERRIGSACAALVLLALGDRTPLFELSALLTAGSVRYPVRYLTLAALALALLAGFAAQRVVEGGRTRRLAAAGGALLALLQLYRGFPGIDDALTEGSLRAGLLLVLALLALAGLRPGLREAVLAALVAGELLATPRPYLETLPAAAVERPAAFARGCELPDAALLAQHRMLSLVPPGAVLARTRARPPEEQPCAAIQAGFGLAPALAGIRSAAVEPVLPLREYDAWLRSSPAMLPRASVRLLVLAGAAGELAPRVIDARPRLFLARGSRPASRELDQAPLPLEEVALEGPAPAGHGQGTIELLEDQPSRIALRATLDSAGLLVATERWEEGWRATVDGASGAAPLQRADGMFLALPLPGGRHDVVLTYRAPWVRPSLALTAVVWLLLVVAVVRPVPGRGMVG